MNLVNHLSENKISFTMEDDVITITEKNKSVNMYLIDYIPSYYTIIFNNKGDVHLSNIKYILNDMFFNNKGDIHFRDLEKITSNVEFNNGGDIYLSSLKEITSKVLFNNEGIVDVDTRKQNDNVVLQAP